MVGVRLTSHDAEHGLLVIMVFVTSVGLWSCLPPPIGMGVPLIPSKSSDAGGKGSTSTNASATDEGGDVLGGVPIEGVLAAGLILPLAYSLWVSFSRARSARQRSLLFVLMSVGAMWWGYRKHGPALLNLASTYPLEATSVVSFVVTYLFLQLVYGGRNREENEGESGSSGTKRRKGRGRSGSKLRPLATPMKHRQEASTSADDGRGGRGAGGRGRGGGGGGGGIASDCKYKVQGNMIPSPADERRIKSLRKRVEAELEPLLRRNIDEWADTCKGMTALLLQFVRARPEAGEGIEEAFTLIKRTARWRVMHNVRSVFDKTYDKALHREMKRRLMNSFFYKTSIEGLPVYYNNMAQGDLKHDDLVPSRAVVNDMSVMWIQEMEYREQVIFPQCCDEHGTLVNQMIVVFDAAGAGISTLKLLKYLPVTLGLNAEYYPESVKSILVTNAPALINMLMAAVNPFLPEATKKKIKITRTNGGDILEAQGVPRDRLPRECGGSGPAKADIRENYHEELYKFLYARSPGGGGTQGEHGGGAAEDSSGGGIAFDDPCWEEFAQDPNDEAWAKWRSGPGAGR